MHLIKISVEGKDHLDVTRSKRWQMFLTCTMINMEQGQLSLFSMVMVQ